MNSSAEHEIINLSKQKWDWMSAQDDAPLTALFNEQAVFVHMGATFSKEQELDVIKTGRIHYRDVTSRTSRSGSSEAPPSCSPHFSSEPWWMGTKSRTPSSSPRSTCNKPTRGPWHRCPSRDSSRTS
jgi:hypothetical protein